MAVVTSAFSKELPPEIWKKILSNMDESDLMMTCRLVNKTWRDLANEALCEKSCLWKPTFDRISAFASGRRATRFSTLEQITRFMEEMKRSTNPFPNGTVIFIFNDYLTEEEHVSFPEIFCNLLDTYRDTILNLVYSDPHGYHPEDMDLSPKFRSILNLSKLKSLLIDGQIAWANVDFFTPSSCQKFKELKESSLSEKITEIQIRGNGGVIPLFYMFDGLESLLKSVSSIEIYNHNRGHLRPDPNANPNFPLCQFPNLKKLKLRYPDAVFLQQFQQFQPNCGSSLKEVSFRFDLWQCDRIEVHFKEIFPLLDYHAATLELLHLQLDFAEHEIFGPPYNIILNSSVKYTKLKTLVLKYDISYWPGLFDVLNPKLVNLKEVTLIPPVHWPDFKEVSEREQYGKIVTCWDQLPATVMIIHVPNYGWKIKRGETRPFAE